MERGAGHDVLLAAVREVDAVRLFDGGDRAGRVEVLGEGRVARLRDAVRVLCRRSASGGDNDSERDDLKASGEHGAAS